jgi:hypothetical protein
MSQDSCDDEQTDSPPTSVDKPSGQGATNTSQGHQGPIKPSCGSRLPTTWNWNVVFNGMLAVTTFLLMVIAYQQLESAHVEQRAWVSMKEMKMATFKEDAVRVDIKLTNSGKTPALDVNVALSVFNRANGPPTEKDHAAYLVRNKHEAIFPGSQTYEIAKVASPISQAELDSIMVGKKVLYVLGDIEYTDVFRESHFTKFCGIYKPEQGTFHACAEHQGVS